MLLGRQWYSNLIVCAVSITATAELSHTSGLCRSRMSISVVMQGVCFFKKKSPEPVLQS